MLWTVVVGVPFALLSVGLAGFIRIATQRRGNVVRMPRRRLLSGRAS
jgi:hypothetical protein